MANEKVDAVIVGAGASGSVFAAVLAKAGKKVVLLEQGPDWQLSDLISSDFWGRRIKPASGPFLLEGKNPFGYVYQAGWGVGGAVWLPRTQIRAYRWCSPPRIGCAMMSPNRSIGRVQGVSLPSERCVRTSL
jgi:choline dehydrogenase-like flavoprotein